MAVQAAAALSARPVLKRDGSPPKKQAPALAKDSVKVGNHPNVGDVAKIGGKTAGGAVLGYISTLIYDLFFHGGNNGGKFYGGGVYGAAAAAGAAIGAFFGIRKYQKQQEQLQQKQQ